MRQVGLIRPIQMGLHGWMHHKDSNVYLRQGDWGFPQVLTVHTPFLVEGGGYCFYISLEMPTKCSNAQHLVEY